MNINILRFLLDFYEQKFKSTKNLTQTEDIINAQNITSSKIKQLREELKNIELRIEDANKK